jgi:hypothetical protein
MTVRRPVALADRERTVNLRLVEVLAALDGLRLRQVEVERRVEALEAHTDRLAARLARRLSDVEADVDALERRAER